MSALSDYRDSLEEEIVASSEDTLYTDISLNLSELKVPVGKLKISNEELGTSGRSLKELYKRVELVKNTPTRYVMGSEEFDINNRRYTEADGTLNPQKAASDFAVVIASLVSTPEMIKHFDAASGNNHNRDIPEHQVLGTMMIGIANIFYNGAGVALNLNSKTMDVSNIFEINKSILSGLIVPNESPLFSTLETVTELQSTTSLAMDVFIGRINGTIGQNGIYDTERKKLGVYITKAMLAYIESINDSMIIEALVSEVRDPKWNDREIDLSIFMDSVDFRNRIDKACKSLKKRLGGVSMKMINTFVELSLATIDIGDGSFVNGMPKPFLRTAEETFNEVFSNYIIVLASAINGPYPLAGTTGVPARKTMIRYIDVRNEYETLISGLECTPENLRRLTPRRILNEALTKYWKDDTAHSRLLRHSVGIDVSRYEGSIEIILSSSGDIITGQYTDTLSEHDLYDMGDDEDDSSETATPTPRTSVQTKQDQKEESEMTKSILSNSKRGKNVSVINEGPLVDNVGTVIDIVDTANKDVKFIHAGLAWFKSNRNDGQFDLTEVCGDRVIGEMVDNNFVFNGTPEGELMNELCTSSRDNYVIHDSGIIMEFEDNSGSMLVSNLLTDNPEHAVRESTRYIIGMCTTTDKCVIVNDYNSTLELPTIDGDIGVIAGGRFTNSESVVAAVHPSLLYKTVNSSNWINAINSTGVPYNASLNGAPVPLMILSRLVVTSLTNLGLRILRVGEGSIIAAPKSVLETLQQTTDHTLNITMEDGVSGLEDSAYVGLIGFTTVSGDAGIIVLPLASIDYKPTANGRTANTTAEGDAMYVNLGDVFAVGPRANTRNGHAAVITICRDGNLQGKSVGVPSQVKHSGGLVDNIEESLYDEAIDVETDAYNHFANMNQLIDSATDVEESPVQTHVSDTQEHEIWEDDDVESPIPTSKLQVLGAEEVEESAPEELDTPDVIEQDVSGDDTELHDVEETTPSESVSDTFDVDDGLGVPDDEMEVLEEVNREDFKLVSSLGVLPPKLNISKTSIERINDKRHDVIITNKEKAQLAFNQHLNLPEDATNADILDSFIFNYEDKFESTAVVVDGVKCYKVDSMDTTSANGLVSMAYTLGATTYEGIDIVPAEGHSWLITTRFSECNKGLIIHIVDMYDTSIDTKMDVSCVDVLDSDISSISEVLAETDECMPDELPMVISGVNLHDPAIRNLDDMVITLVNNVRRKVEAEWDSSNLGSNFKIIEFLDAVSGSSDFPRRLTKRIIRDAINRVTAISSKYCCNSTMLNDKGVGISLLANHIMVTWESINATYDEATAFEYLKEINDISVIDNEDVDVLVVEVMSDSIGLLPNTSNVPAESVPFDTQSLKDGMTVLTSDEVLLRYNDNDILPRANFSLVNYW